ncbi:hypothetical protein BCR33DRAFT_831069 [Rhizoclosmatium globosum]|uniref:CoA-dependent acyltransferase n=1 Tax=Rhizoclosmatium globosum TaxID=329046 RepID=A0A1Y2BXG0_9FUNG|nr:hypothetical protein BCR33DRAFT_831069 [Rhizoclosmatium globosum]|eukprot:ORY39337.1 hypothetical protein BCR33DRAFT_831069 [Rhizoclosmatium globosum]
MKAFHLTAFEETVATRASSMENVTFFVGEPPIEFLRNRVETIIRLNPFLAGRFYKPDIKDSKIELRVQCSEEGVLYDSVDLSAHFQVIRDIDFSPADGYVNVCGKISRIPNLVIPIAKVCLETNAPLFRVAVLLHSNKKQFAVVTTLSHTIGDGFSFYSLYKMLSYNVQPYAMIFDRVDTKLAEREVFPDSSKDISKFAMPVFGSLISTIASYIVAKIRITVVSLYFCVWGMVNTPSINWINEQKAIAIKESGYVSTNDCLAHWILTRAKCDYAALLVNQRGRVPSLTTKHFGNYVSLLYLKREDFATPSLIRKALHGPILQRAVTVTPFDGYMNFFCRIGTITNLSSFYEDIELEGCKRLLHWRTRNLQQETSPFCSFNIFPESKGKLKVVSDFYHLF